MTFTVRIKRSTNGTILGKIPTIIQPIMGTVFSNPELITTGDLPIVNGCLLRHGVVGVSVPIIDVPLSANIGC